MTGLDWLLDSDPTVPGVRAGDSVQLLVAGSCLTGVETAPCQQVTVPPNAFNVRSTRANVQWLINQTATAALAGTPLPGIVIQTNPTIGLAQVDSWFWVDPTTYGGQAYSHSVTLPAPWTVDWDYLVHHRDAIYGPCPGDPTQSCVVGFNEWDETGHGRKEHIDVVTATVTLRPGLYAWDFGDDADGPLA